MNADKAVRITPIFGRQDGETPEIRAQEFEGHADHSPQSAGEEQVVEVCETEADEVLEVGGMGLQVGGVDALAGGALVGRERVLGEAGDGGKGVWEGERRAVGWDGQEDGVGEREGLGGMSVSSRRNRVVWLLTLGATSSLTCTSVTGKSRTLSTALLCEISTVFPASTFADSCTFISPSLFSLLRPFCPPLFHARSISIAPAETLSLRHQPSQAQKTSHSQR